MCDLCNLADGNTITTLYYQDNVVVVVDCSTHKIPMVVLNHHGEATEWELGYLEGIANSLFMFKNIRKEPGAIKDHAHFHLEGAVYVGSSDVVKVYTKGR